jgi:hypothetical protein
MARIRQIGLLTCALLVLCSGVWASLDFDGVDDAVDTGAVTGSPTGYPLTLATVVKITDHAGHQSFFQSGTYPSGFMWHTNLTSGTLAMNNLATLTEATSTGAVPTGAWVFLAVSSASATSHRLFCYNYATRAIVFNETNATNIGATTAPSGVVSLGRFGGGGYQMKGTMAWVAAYARDMTGSNGAAFLAMAHLGPYHPFTPSLLYAFEESTGTTARERMAGLHGTLTGFPGTQWVPTSLPGPIRIP